MFQGSVKDRPRRREKRGGKRGADAGRAAEKGRRGRTDAGSAHSEGQRRLFFVLIVVVVALVPQSVVQLTPPGGPGETGKRLRVLIPGRRRLQPILRLSA